MHSFGAMGVEGPPAGRLLAGSLLGQGCNRRRTNRPLLVVDETFADCDALRRLMIDHLKTDPLACHGAMKVKRDIAIDVAKSLVTRIRERACEVRRKSRPHERG